MALKNDLLLRAARGEKTERTPVWIMRQAGRILKEYMQVRNSVSGFIELVSTPELAAEVTIQPIDILGVDAAIIFSDILVIPEAMGLPYKMVEAKGPLFEKTIDKNSDMNFIRIAEEEGYNYVLEAIKITKQELNDRVPLIGFAGAPWTIFSYMIEGSGSKTFSKARKVLYSEPDFAHQLLDMITKSTINYLKSQINAGADIVQIFDSWAGILPDYHYREFGIKYIKEIVDAIDEVPVIVFPKGANNSINSIAGLENCQVIGVDWNISPQQARSQASNKVIQGNLDPAVLYGSHKSIEQYAGKMLDQFGFEGHIANLGHGVYPDIEADKVKHYIDFVKEYTATK